MKAAYIKDRLESVSPSRYGRLRAWSQGLACPLQILWAGDPLLAPSPAPKLGDVVHAVMEKVHGDLDEEQVEGLWERELEKLEQKLAASWVTKGLIPLESTLKGYDTRRIMAIRMAKDSSQLRSGKRKAPGNSAEVLKEEPLQSPDGILVGKVDLVVKQGNEWTIIDYKTGAIFEKDESDELVIKEDYELQMLLYSALLREARGIKATSALLKPLDGKTQRVGISQEQVESIANEARRLLAEFNALVGSIEDMQQLALPMPKKPSSRSYGCSGCQYRPGCYAYVEAEKSNSPDAVWPNDVIGAVENIASRNGLKFVTLRVSPQKTETVQLKDSDDRHPNLRGVSVGDRVGIFDVANCRLVMADGPRTCVYSLGHA